jgi:drug/metabolite transporter (DMT)-like permease
VLTIILGFATSLVYGFADFFGAIASRRIKPVTVTFVSGAIGLAFLLALSIFVGADFSPGALFWGTAAGITSAIAMSALYASLAIGPISIVSPLSAVISAIVPSAVGFAQGDRFSTLGFAGLGAILVAVFLVGFVPGKDVRLPSMKGLVLAVIAGGGIGVVLICLDQAPADSGLAPVILLRATAAAILGAVTLFTFGAAIRRKLRTSTKPEPDKNRGNEPDKVPIKFWYSVAVTGLFDASANVFFILASRIGSLTVVSVLTALYPLGTIILARIFLKEKLARTQTIGVLLALGGSALLVVS